MAKEKYARTVLSRKSRASAPYPATGGAQDAVRPLLKKEWEDAICPICMNPPHAAVLLLCSSYEKGCRPYICNTSHRHSNCLDQLQKTSAALDTTLLSLGSDDVNQSSPPDLESVNNSGPEAPMSGTISASGNLSSEEDAQHNAGLELNTHVRPQFACPLCRGQVKNWEVIPDSQRYLNKKTRSCAHESCPFSGTYAQLRKHVRRNHPHDRPTEIDPVRQRNWQRLEEESNIGDVLSVIQSTMPGALISGDYVIENDDIYDEFDDNDFSSDED